ncbi:chemotaxis protein CheD [Malonomonas rubra DSM 5091]|uniref:Probable chemoreceptor glutamine deamidase CheD n=1 Tax=Malonomonas rubra DSM 5091 TaxID=1122189 RepID=A0A1M6MKX7_MALRU|nr:chemotaxis protein CheD [Malonomonas rubra]SHJ83933.1 chemotaxis protein CheD [Malonomonas rubra DSM 5091]
MIVDIAGTEASLFLKPGELAVTNTPTRVSTVLGSCIALTLYNPRLKCGAICHAVLPQSGCEGGNFRYVDSAFGYMLERFQHMGIALHEIDVKLFGGSEVLRKQSPSPVISIGRSNIEAAKSLVAQKGLALKVEHVGGPVGRKIHFFTHTGVIYLRHLQAA